MTVRWIPLTLLIAAIIEVVVFVLVADAIGWGWAVLAAVATSIVGALLTRREGVRAWRRFRTVTAAGERPGTHLTRALVGLIGAFLLMAPGFVTDIIGALLLLPPVRGAAGRAVAGLAARRLPSAAMGDLFGPRRVRVKVGKPTSAASQEGTAPDAHGSAAYGGDQRSPGANGGEILEGEIIDPR